MNTSRRTPPVPVKGQGRPIAEAAADALREVLPPQDDGLGPVGEKALRSLIDEADQDEEQHKTLMRFAPHWRAFIRKQEQHRLDALDDIIDDYLERKALRKFWLRIWRLSIIVVPVIFGWASGFFEKVWPLMQKIIKLLQAPPT